MDVYAASVQYGKETFSAVGGLDYDAFEEDTVFTYEPEGESWALSAKLRDRKRSVVAIAVPDEYTVCD